MRRNARKSQWVIAKEEGGTWSVFRSGRSVLTGTRDIETAKLVVGRSRAVHDKVILIEDDGYRVDITREFEGARVR